MKFYKTQYQTYTLFIKQNKRCSAMTHYQNCLKSISIGLMKNIIPSSRARTMQQKYFIHLRVTNCEKLRSQK